jgi:hypothetical protein
VCDKSWDNSINDLAYLLRRERRKVHFIFYIIYVVIEEDIEGREKKSKSLSIYNEQ